MHKIRERALAFFIICKLCALPSHNEFIIRALVVLAFCYKTRLVNVQTHIDGRTGGP